MVNPDNLLMNSYFELAFLLLLLYVARHSWLFLFSLACGRMVMRCIPIATWLHSQSLIVPVVRYWVRFQLLRGDSYLYLDVVPFLVGYIISLIHCTPAAHLFLLTLRSLPADACGSVLPCSPTRTEQSSLTSFVHPGALGITIIGRWLIIQSSPMVDSSILLVATCRNATELLHTNWPCQQPPSTRHNEPTTVINHQAANHNQPY